ncbi:squalene synthase [Amylocystis lapponica]|nr:squalene synthase [Amylocystis lapponica]
MGALSMLALLITHPLEFRTLVQYKLWHEGHRDITARDQIQYTGWDRPAMRKCWEFLEMTSRSFATVVKEPEGDLARVICLFYLVLRGLDTIEDDMTLPDEKKQPILRDFHKLTVTPEWTFTESGPDEKDRQLLVEYTCVSEEMIRLEERYRSVIIDIAEKMGAGMADYAHKAVTAGLISVETVDDYNLYCHYVAGLVGEGLTRLIAASDKEVSWMAGQLELANSMGLMLQKTNIIRDYREDADERRFFWPREIWGDEKYGAACGRSAFKEVTELYKPGNKQQALWVLSGMIADALSHATDCLDYLRLLRQQGVFNFCAIPQTMAMATLHLCFMNYEMFQHNIKIRKAEAAALIMKSTNPRDVAYIFRDYARQIHQKAVPEDPNYIRIAVVCGQIELWCENHYPSFVQFGEQGKQSYDPDDARTRIVLATEEKERLRAKEKRIQELNGKFAAMGRAPMDPGSQSSIMEVVPFVIAAFLIVLAVGFGGFWALVKFVGE